jgi:hypothetical protein
VRRNRRPSRCHSDSSCYSTALSSRLRGVAPFSNLLGSAPARGLARCSESVDPFCCPSHLFLERFAGDQAPVHLLPLPIVSTLPRKQPTRMRPHSFTVHPRLPTQPQTYQAPDPPRKRPKTQHVAPTKTTNPPRGVPPHVRVRTSQTQPNPHRKPVP